MSQIDLTIDGQDIQVPSGTTILEAAKAADIYIPTLCYHPDLPGAKGAQAPGPLTHVPVVVVSV